MVEVKENVAIGKFRKRFRTRFCSQMCSDKNFLELFIHPVFIEFTRMITDGTSKSREKFVTTESLLFTFLNISVTTNSLCDCLGFYSNCIILIWLVVTLRGARLAST